MKAPLAASMEGPEYASLVAAKLQVPPHCCHRLSPDRVVCIVTEDWVRRLFQGKIQQQTAEPVLDPATAEKYLARSCTALPSPWTRLSVKVWPKTEQGTHSLWEGVSPHSQTGDSLLELMTSVAHDNLHNVWLAAEQKHRRAQSHRPADHQPHHSPSASNAPLSDMLWHWMWRLSPDIHLRLSEDASGKTVIDTVDSVKSASLQSLLQQQKFKPSHTPDEQLLRNVTRVQAVVETDDLFLVIQPYVAHRLQDVLSYSPALLDTCHTKPLFILYQVLQAMAGLHARGMPVGNISCSTVLLDADLWAQVVCPQKQALVPPAADLSPPAGSVGSSGEQPSQTQPQTSEGNGWTSDKNSGIKTSNRNTSLSTSSQESDAASNSTHPSRRFTVSSPDENERVYLEACQFLQQEKFKLFSLRDVEQLTDAWVYRQLSNFQYLMILNHLAGRTMNDPNNHPVLPWVMDFTNAHDGYRDLTKSKFRLNKGDSQLDFTYGLHASYGSLVTDLEDPDHIPHHVSDVLSDITYYVYKARRMPQPILCAHVRSNWVPHEYPASMQRMQEWTPDECIPEFFTDPTIFQSIHSDLADLEIPPWCCSARDFVVKHMATLESDRVSEQLHHWIDLTFGYKLSGRPAVAAKNVYLQLVDGHKMLRGHGVMQLFSLPHPPRLLQASRLPTGPPRILREVLSTQLMHTRFRSHEECDLAATELGNGGMGENVRPEMATVHLPYDFDPLDELEHCEALLNFKNKALLHSGVDSPATADLARTRSRLNDLVLQDMASFLCLVCEIFLAPKLRMQGTAPSLRQRLERVRVLCGDDYSVIPRPFQNAARLLTDLHVEDEGPEQGRCKVHFSSTVLGGYPPPTPFLLLHPQADVLPFPSYFPPFYACLCHLKAIDQVMEEVQRGTDSPAEKAAMLKQFARSKVPVMENFLLVWGDRLGREGLQLVLPLVDSLLGDKLTTVQAAWELFNIMSQALGPTETANRFLSSLVALFSELPASAKHVKLYHRTFLTTLMLRLHLQPFLNYFATLLVEAVAGYKDFALPSRFYQEELLEEMEAAQQDQQTNWLPASYFTGSSPRASAQPEPGVDDGGVEDEGDGFVDGMSLGDDVDVGDDLDFDVEGEDSTSLDQESEGNYWVDEQNSPGEGGTFDPSGDNADRYSIHSISNILGAGARRHSSLGENEEDNVSDSPRSASERGMFKPVSGASLSSMLSESPTMQLEAEDAQTPINQCGGSSGDLAGGDHSVDEEELTSASHPGDKSLEVQDSAYHNGVTAPLKVKVADGNTEGEDDVDALGGTGGGRKRERTGRSSTESMRRSETEDLMSSLSLNSPSSAVNIRHIAADSVKWLTLKLGPVLAARYLSRNLVRMLPLCYLGDCQLQSSGASGENVVKTSRHLVGDGNAAKVLECIAFVPSVYGESIIVIQYLPSVIDMISVAQRRLTQRSESGLLGAVILLRSIVPLLSDKTLMDVLEETIVGDCISPLLSMLTSTSLSFPGGRLSRSVLCYKLVDLLYVLGLRLGLEMTRRFLHHPMLALMEAFTVVHAPGDAALALSQSPVLAVGSQDESYITIKMDSATHQYTIGTPVNPSTLSTSDPAGVSLSPAASRWHSLSAMNTVDERDECLSPRHEPVEKCHQELASVFTPELALAVYIPLCRIFGSIHMEDSLKNDDLIRQLCAQQDSSMDQPQPSPAHVAAETDISTPTSGSEGEPLVSGALGSNIEVIGNRIQLTDVQQGRAPSPSPSVTQFGRGYRHDGILHITHDELRSQEMELNQTRHLRGNWLQYWEHELGLRERDTLFNFKQIKLQTFIGHSNSIRCIMAMDTENCFISSSKDKTVRLWALTSSGDGSSRVPCQWTYQMHKKSVFSVAYVESVRQVASCDSTVHVWDPFTGQGVCQLESPRYSPATALQAIPAPSTQVLMGTTEAKLRFLDMRTHKYSHEYKCSIGSTGLLRCVAVSPDGGWVAVGFSTGVISVLELTSGMLQASWKAHEGEILQIKAFSKYRLVSSSFDGTVRVWSVEGGNEICPLKGPSDPVLCFSFYRDQVLSATAANRVGVHSLVGENATFTSVKLRSDTFRGVLTTMAVLPLNRTLLLGSDNGMIQLLA